jgi:hypothetical protein
MAQCKVGSLPVKILGRKEIHPGFDHQPQAFQHLAVAVASRSMRRALQADGLRSFEGTGASRRQRDGRELPGRVRTNAKRRLVAVARPVLVVNVAAASVRPARMGEGTGTQHQNRDCQE